MSPLNNFQQDQDIADSYQAGVATLPEPKTYEEAAAALKTVSEEDTVMGRSKDAYEVYKLQAKDRTMLTAKEANAQFPGMETPFRQNVSPSVAKYLHDKQLEKQKLSESISSGPQDAWSRAKYAGVGLWAHVTDPVETGAAILGSVATGGLAEAGFLGEAAGTVSTAAKLKKLAAAGEISSAVARAGEATLGARVGLSVAENVAGGLSIAGVQETAKAAQAAAHGTDYSFKDAWNNFRDQAAYGVAFGIATPLIGEAFRGLLGRRSIPVNELEAADLANNALSRRIQEMSPEAKVGLIKTAVADASELRVTSPRNLVDSLSQETAVSPEEFAGKFQYEHQPVGKVIAAGSKFYVVGDSSNFETATRSFTSDAMGTGTHMTDHPGVANATAARSMNEGSGVVHEIKAASDINTFRIDEKFSAQTAKEAAVFENALRLAGDPNPVQTVAEASPKEIIDYLHDLNQPEAIQAYEQGLKDLGYDALTSEGTSRNNVGHPAHNAVMMLDDAKIEPSRYFTPDPGVVKAPDPATLRGELIAREGVSGRLDIDPAKLQKFIADAETFKFDPKEHASAIETANKNNLEYMDALAKQGDLDASDRAVYERLLEMETRQKDERTLTKAVLGCITGIL